MKTFREIMRNKELPMSHKLVFSYLCINSENGKAVFKNKDLADYFGISERQIIKICNRLIEEGLVSKDSRVFVLNCEKVNSSSCLVNPSSPDVNCSSVNCGSSNVNSSSVKVNSSSPKETENTEKVNPSSVFSENFENLREKKEAKKRDLITNINNDLPININNIDPCIENTEYNNINTTKILKKQDDKSDLVRISDNSNQITYTGENFQLTPQTAGEIVPIKPKKTAPKKSEPFRIPSREEVMELSKWYVQNKKDSYPDLIYVDLDYFCDDFFDKQESNGWRQNNGRPYKSWQGAVKFWLRIQMQMTMQGLKPRRELTNEELVEDYERTMCGKALPQPPEVEVMEETEEEKAERRKKELEEWKAKNGITW